jgi:hypothetical protein
MHVFDRAYSSFVPFYSLPDDNHEQVEVVRRDVHDNGLFITDCVIC